MIISFFDTSKYILNSQLNLSSLSNGSNWDERRCWKEWNKGKNKVTNENNIMIIGSNN